MSSDQDDSVTAVSTGETSPPARKEFRFSIWPPTQRTRDAVTSRLVETLSAPSALSKRYGTLSPEEATPVARLIEEEAFSAGDSHSSAEADGIAVLQLYSREISRRMLDAVKDARSESPVEGARSES